jgi:O-antigen/teichoic acid export membrane protein
LSEQSNASAKSGRSLGERAASGTLWTAIRILCEYALRLGSNLILSRLLVPESFGLMLLVSVLMTGLAMFSDVGISAIVVQSRRGDEPAFLNTVWTIQVIRGAVLTAFASLLAFPMAHFYGIPELRELIWVASLTALIGGFNSIAMVSLQRHLQIKRHAVIEVSGQVWSTSATITLGLLYPTVWALVIGGLIGSLGRLVLTHAMTPEFRCHFKWERSSVSDLVDFGKWIFISTILFFLAGQSDRLIFGQLFSIGNLGVFSFAMVLATIPTQIIWRIGSAVVFPALSRRRESEKGLVPIYRRARLPLLVLGGFPVAFLLSSAPSLIEFLYDPRYIEAGWMLQILAIATWFQIPQSSSGTVLLALGIPRSIAVANAAKFAALIVFLPVGYMKFGDAGAIAGLAGAEVFRYAALAVAIRRLKLPILLVDVVMTMLVGAVSLVALTVHSHLEQLGYGPLARMGSCLVIISALWIPASAFLLRKEIPNLRQGLKDRRARKSAA